MSNLKKLENISCLIKQESLWTWLLDRLHDVVKESYFNCDMMREIRENDGFWVRVLIFTEQTIKIRMMRHLLGSKQT